MRNQRGFIGLGVLVAILIGLVAIGGGTYYAVHRQSSLPTASGISNNTETLPINTPATQTDANSSTSAFNTFIASPTSGTAGHAITFSSSLGGKNDAGYFIDWGDNTTTRYTCGQDIPVLGISGGDPEKCLPVATQHIYVAAGTYTATLEKITSITADGHYASAIVGTAIVTITGNNALPSPTCTLTASPSTVSVAQKVTISWTTQNSNAEGPSGYGAWVGQSSQSIGLLEQMTAPTSVNGRQTVTAQRIGTEKLGLEINGPGGSGEGACSVTVTAIMTGQSNMDTSHRTHIGGSYYKDSQYVYSQIAYGAPQVISGADPATFVYLGTARGYEMGKDAQHVYVFTQVSSADSSALVILDRGEWMKDSQHIYEGGGLGPVAGADPNTFSIIQEGNFIKDAMHVWTWNGNLLSNADPSTFAILTGGYERDASHVWYGAQLIPNANVSTFVITGDGTAKDANHVYGHTAPDHLGNTQPTIDGVPVQS